MTKASKTTKAKRANTEETQGELTQKQLKEIHGIMRQINESWRQHNKELKRMFAKYDLL